MSIPIEKSALFLVARLRVNPPTVDDQSRLFPTRFPPDFVAPKPRILPPRIYDLYGGLTTWKLLLCSAKGEKWRRHLSASPEDHGCWL